MGERRPDPQVSSLYLELAAECFNKAATTLDARSSATLQRMARAYFAEAVVLNPSLKDEQLMNP
jgi:hypothetical protein